MDNVVKMTALLVALSAAYFAGNKSSRPMGMVIAMVDDVEIE